MKELSERRKKWIERTIANDRSNKKMLYNRFILFLLFVFLQLCVFISTVFLLAYGSPFGLLLQLVSALIAAAATLHVVNSHERPSTRVNWIVLILIVPIVGVPMYLMYGEGRPMRSMRRRILPSKVKTEQEVKEFYGEKEVENPQERAKAGSYYLEKYENYPVYADGTIEYHKTGEEAFPVILRELRKAEKFILLEYFIIAHGKMWTSILRILLEKAKAGVQVRIIYDGFGCMMNLPPKYDRYLESLHPNIKCLTFNTIIPVFSMRLNNRDHRKMLIIDGKVAFTGGYNLADEYIGEKLRFGYWKDTGVKVTGSAVRSFTKMFFYMWNAFRKKKEDVQKFLLSEEETDKHTDEPGISIQPYDDTPLLPHSTGEAVYIDIINRAEKYVYITTPYLILDDFIRASLCRAALRGVDVRIVTPGIPDKKIAYRLTRANYAVLLKAGVKIYEYTPGFIHAKNMVCDDKCAVVGTINLDYRSLYLHFENAVYFSDCLAVMDVKRDCEETVALSYERTLENSKQSVFGKLFDSVLRLFETLM
ncbi:MAG: cardiolipin synthase [Clostridia bacterium]|nr:cardiolipin synthase [Clostridia bacterium]